MRQYHEDGDGDGGDDDEVPPDANAGPWERLKQELQVLVHVACFQSCIWEHLPSALAITSSEMTHLRLVEVLSIRKGYN